ncbi:MAG TPA: DUF2760 domain-containing protein [Pirellulales bacterium]|nr:DUF2760 domain-containing protein [Pirellulales bacterium]
MALLALLQREARFVDFIQEDLSAYSDAQIGAAARDVQRQSAAVITRAFGVGAIVDGSEGSEQTVPAGFDAARYKLTGNVTGQPPYRGRLRHHGWQASRCVLPAFTGSVEAAQILAPVEIELS